MKFSFSFLLMVAFIAVTTALPTADYPVTVGRLNLLSASAKDVSDALGRGEVTSVQLVEAYLARIAAHNHKGLNLRAIIEVAPHSNVVEIANSLDAERRAGKTRGPLHGVPIIVKDNYDTHAELGMNTTAGSYVLLNDGGVAIKDAFVIERLRKAGAIILAKANLMVWSGISGVNASAWSPRGGQVSSPFVEGGFEAGGDPSGSSSGSGAGVAAGFAPLALGSDTEGSIVNPSSRGALYGLRPSTGLTSRTGVVPISSSVDTTGPLGKSAWDVAVSLSIMAGRDEDDEFTWPANVESPKNYKQFLQADGFRNLRVGIIREPFFRNSTARERLTVQAFDAAMEKMKGLGATVLETPLHNSSRFEYAFVGSPKRQNNGTILIQYDFKADIAHYLTTRRQNATITSLEGVINSGVKHFKNEYPGEKCCFPTFVAADQLGDRESSGEYWLARQTQDRLDREETMAIFERYNIDVIAIPTEFDSARLGAVGRLPVGSVPLGYDQSNLPFGLAFVGKRYDEPSVIRAMSAYEAQFPARRVPTTLL